MEKGKLLPVIKDTKINTTSVITGIALINKDTNEVIRDYAITKVTLREMNEQDIPFILYTDKTSKYIHHLENSLLRLNSSFKKIKSYSIPPAVGVQVGKYAVGVGYILKNDQSK